ncbi:MAG: TPR repeat protein [Gammaproteobacteria bacterium]|jgi:TPR repeat protein
MLRSYLLPACAVLIAILVAGLAMQNQQYEDAVAQLAKKETEAQAYQLRLDESALHAASMQSKMDKLITYRDGQFAQALAAFDEASDSKTRTHEGFTRAYAMWSELAQAGDTRANYHMGIMNMYGIGGARFEQLLGIGNVRIAAENGYPIAQSLMGFLVERSDGTMVKTGDELALSWWQRGAEGNHCIAVRRMVTVYKNGELGVEADAKQTAEWEARQATCQKR